MSFHYLVIATTELPVVIYMAYVMADMFKI
jgi:hypothetical protein